MSSERDKGINLKGNLSGGSVLKTPGGKTAGNFNARNIFSVYSPANPAGFYISPIFSSNSFTADADL